MNALLIGAQITLSKDEYAGGMGQRSNYAAVMDAQIKLGREECAINMGQRLNTKDAVVKGAQIKSSKEEYVGDMVQEESANTRDAKVRWAKEDCAGGMGQR